jgi:hypothetical protein
MGPRSILIVYYPVFMVGVDEAKDGRFPRCLANTLAGSKMGAGSAMHG